MPTATLQEQMQTRQYDFFDEGGFLMVDQFFADLEKVRRHYRNNGYPSMRFTGDEASQRPSSRKPGGGSDGVSLEIQRFRDRTQYSYVLEDKAFQVSKNDWENPVYIVVGIHEGPQSVFSSAEFSGVEALDRSDLPAELRRSSPYSPFLLQKGLAGLKRTYENLGYRKVEIEATCSEESMEGEYLPCALFPAEALRVKLRVAVRPGPRSYMGELFIHGVRRSSVSMIEDLFPREGEPFDKERMDGGLKTLRNLGVFSSVRASYVGLEETPPREKVAVVIWVEEGGNRFVDVSLGFQTISRPGEDRLMDPMVSDLLSQSIHNVSSLMTGRSGFQRINFPDLLLMTEVSYTDRNFLGLAKELTLPVSYGLSTTDMFRYASFMPTYVDRRFLGLDLTMRLTPLIEYDRALRELDIFEYGVETEFSHWLEARRIQLSLLTRLSRISWKEIYERDFGPLESQVKATPQVRFDWRNSPTNPSKGAFLGLRCSYINALNESGARDNFVKYDASTQAYVPFRNILVLAGNVRAGGSLSGLGADLPANHRFRLGGTSGVRGFPAGGILQYRANGTPRTEVATMSVSGSNQKGFLVVNDGDFVLNGSVELRYPLLRKSDLWGSVFVDWGAITESFGELTSNSFRFSVGPGVRWLLGGQIPLRIDYGFVRDRRCNKVDFQTGKPSARDSAGALDFGILYTF
jgi:outer membrane protein assembly factor BamA